MKSKEVYSILRSELGPWFKANGFRRSEGMLSWARERNPGYVVVWCQVSKHGWDEYAGSSFVAEFQLAARPELGALTDRRARLSQFLSLAEKEEVRRIQNNVIAGLTPPPPDHPMLQISPAITRDYLKAFQPVSDPYTDRADIWLRYRTRQDLTRWAQFIEQKLPECISVVDGWG